MTEKIQMKNVGDRPFTEDDPPGSFSINFNEEYNKGCINFICHKKIACGIHITKGPGRDRSPTQYPIWSWNGNREQPDTKPSISCRDCWHGFIQDGFLVTH